MATANDVLWRVRAAVNDDAQIHWSTQELLRWASDGQREVAKHVPEAAAVTEAFAGLNVGEVTQRLPAASCYKLIRVEANVLSGTVDASVPVVPVDGWTLVGTLPFDADETLSLTYVRPVGASVGNNSATVFLFVAGGTSAARPDLTSASYGGVSLLSLVDAGGGSSFFVPGAVVGTATLLWADGAPATDTLQVTVNNFGTTSSPVTVYARTFNNVVTAHNSSIGYATVNDINGDFGFIAGNVHPGGVGPTDYDIVLFAASANITAGGSITPGAAAKFAFRYSNTEIPTNPTGFSLVAEAEGTQTYWAIHARVPATAEPENYWIWPKPIAGTPNFYLANGRVTLQGTVGTAPTADWGYVIRLVQRDVIDSFAASWQQQSGLGTTESYFKAWAADDLDPCAFYLYPPPRVDDSVFVTYSRIPAELTLEASVLELSDVYVSAIVDYVMFRAYMKRSRAYSPESALAALQRFGEQLKLSREILNSIAAYAQRPAIGAPTTP